MASCATIGCTEFPPHISYTQLRLLGWHDTEGPAWKEEQNLLTFAPDTEQTGSCSCSKRYPCIVLGWYLTFRGKFKIVEISQ